MLNNFRRKLANKIYPEASQKETSHSYPIREVNWKSDEDMIRDGTIEAHLLFEKETGSKAGTDQQARDFLNSYSKNIIAGIMAKEAVAQ